MNDFLPPPMEDSAASLPAPSLDDRSVDRQRCRPERGDGAAVKNCSTGVRWRRLFAIFLLLTFPRSVKSQELTLHVSTIDGSERSGQLVAWTAEQLTLRTDAETVTLSSDELLQVQWFPTSQRGEAVSPSDVLEASQPDSGQTFTELIDGTRLPHQTYLAKAGQAKLSTRLSQQPLEISTAQIQFVQLAADAVPGALTSQESSGDLLVIRKKGSGQFDTLAGVIGDVSAEQVEFKWDGEVIPVKRSKVAALSYYQARRHQKVRPICWLTLRDGARLPAAEIRHADDMVVVRTSAGLDLTFSLASIRDADYSQGKLAYLSDLTPVYQQWTPRINLPASAEVIRQHGMPRLDQSFSGSALTLFWPTMKPTTGKRKASNSGGFRGELSTHRRGLALRSRTDLRYRVPPEMQRFIAVAGIDPETVGEGSVLLEVFAASQSVWRGEIDGGSAPTPIDVFLGDARELRILVDYGVNLDFGDRLHLVEARLSR